MSFNYHGRLRQEKRSIAAITDFAGIKDCLTLDLPFLKEASEADRLVDSIIQPGSRRASYIPARNLIFYSIAAHFAEYSGAAAIIGGHNLHDAEFFRDSSREFIQKLNQLFEQGCLSCDGKPFRIVLPLVTLKRADVVKLAVKLGVPIELTWSCHKDGKRHCGKCYSCIQRLDAFDSLGISDPVFGT